MRSGEWTRSMALSLAKAVEALATKDEVSPTEVIERFRGITQDPQQASRKLGEQAHQDCFQLTFESKDYAVFPITVKVDLLCEECRTHTHNWVSWEVNIIEKEDTRPGETWWTYQGSIGEHLVRTGFDSSEADY